MLTVFPHCLRDPHLKTTYTSVGFPPVYGVPLNRVWNCARRRYSPLLQSIYSIGHRSKSFSRRKTSRTSAHFRAGHKTRIHPAIGWLSLLPTSHTRTSMGSPCGLLSPKRETYGVTTFRILSIVGLGACCRPGGSMVHDAARYRRHSRPPLPFGSSPKASLACSISRSLSQIYFGSPYRLSSPLPG